MYPVPRQLDSAQGYANLKQGQPDFASLYLARVKKTAETSTASFRVHTAKNLLGIVAGILEGEIQRTNGDLNGAIATFEKAAAVQNALVYDEPEPLPFHAAHWLGAALIEAKEFDKAEAAYREELKDHPHNGWSLLGIQQALAGKGTKSTEVDADLEKSWSRADTWIRASRF